jgi:uncharacterized phage infection (PIP) family protein YhgE
MANKRIARSQTRNGFQSLDVVKDRPEVRSSGEGRRFLKHLDRRLQQLSHQIDSFEKRVTRLSDKNEADLSLAVESLYRETLLLRAEIRGLLAGGGRSLANMTQYAEESWEQLRETFEELKENLEPQEQSTKLSGSRGDSEDSEEDEAWDWDDEESFAGGDEWVDSEVHPPRAGPKR